jgi:acyl-[acyl-carrier-protein]-phospholipid O-acyltransferase / long-chain-fatty-acid--[acyl-carrier-protein] ligase
VNICRSEDRGAKICHTRIASTERVEDEMRNDAESGSVFAPIAGAYFLGTFNDNFFKQAVLILAVYSGHTAMQGYALAAFTLPFILLASSAGWLADRFPKRTVVVGAKWLELVAMIFGAIGLFLGNWTLIFVMLVTMGAQSAIFSPAINGSIPELFSEDRVVATNGALRLFVTIGIFCGIALAGVVLDAPGSFVGSLPNGRLLVGSGVILVSLVGVMMSYRVIRRPAAAPDKRFPLTGPLHTFRVLASMRRDRLLFSVLAANMFVWFAGSLMVLLMNPMGLQELKLSKSMTSMLIVIQLAGLGVGGLASGRLLNSRYWYRRIAPITALMGIALIALYGASSLGASMSLPLMMICIALSGVAGGMLLIPLESFIQTRPAAQDTGTVWAAGNCAVFCAIIASGPLGNLLNRCVHPTAGFAMLGGATLVVSGIFYSMFNRRNHE